MNDMTEIVRRTLVAMDPSIAQGLERRENHYQGQTSAHRLLYDRKEAARQLSISVRSLDYLIAAGKFETRRIGKKVLVTHNR